MIRTELQLRPSVLAPIADGSGAEPRWRAAVPALTAPGVTLREVRVSDAQSLLENLDKERVRRFVSPPPSSLAGFERFIRWAHHSRAAGRFICFGVVPDGCPDAIGIVQVRAMAPAFAVAEWGFALGYAYWGRGVFGAAADAVLGFVFDTLGAHRVEGRSSVANVRANRAIEKLGATAEGVLRKAFLRNGTYHDQIIWAITVDDWRARQTAQTASAS